MKEYCSVNYLECCKCQPCCEYRTELSKEEAREYKELIDKLKTRIEVGDYIARS